MRSFLNLLENSTLEIIKNLDITKFDTTKQEKLAEIGFVFSFYWTFGSIVNKNDQDDFEKNFRESFKNVCWFPDGKLSKYTMEVRDENIVFLYIFSPLN